MAVLTRANEVGDLLLAEGVITEEQGAQVRRAQELTIRVVDVDDFPRARLERGYAEPVESAPAKTG